MVHFVKLHFLDTTRHYSSGNWSAVSRTKRRAESEMHQVGVLTSSFELLYTCHKIMDIDNALCY